MGRRGLVIKKELNKEKQKTEERIKRTPARVTVRYPTVRGAKNWCF